MPLVFAAIAPHGGIAIAEACLPDEREVAATTRAGMQELGRRFARARPDVTIVATPHNVHIANAVAVVVAARVKGRLNGVLPPIELDLASDPNLAIQLRVFLSWTGGALTPEPGNGFRRQTAQLRDTPVGPTAVRLQDPHGRVLALGQCQQEAVRNVAPYELDERVVGTAVEEHRFQTSNTQPAGGLDAMSAVHDDASAPHHDNRRPRATERDESFDVLRAQAALAKRRPGFELRDGNHDGSGLPVQHLDLRHLDPPDE